MIEVKEKSFIILGLGASGEAAARKLLKLGGDVTVSDASVQYETRKRVVDLEQAGAKALAWDDLPGKIKNGDTVIISPGVAIDSPPVKAAMKRGARVISELELAYRFTESPIVAVTGTNGKSTVVTMLGEVFTAAGIPNIVAGNIGRPLIDAVDEAGPETVLITEVSSFQLEAVESFRPRIGVLLNVTEDHLDRHGTIKEYAKTKARLFANQDTSDYAVINIDDEEAASLQDQVTSTVIPFSTVKSMEPGVFAEDNVVWAVLPPLFEPAAVGSVADLKMRGVHSVENSLAVIAVSLLWGIPAKTVIEAVNSFKGLSHRIEFVAEKSGAKYYDDSKATNPDAVKRALEAFQEPVVLLAGGRNKGMDFKPLKPVIEARVKAAVLFGESADELAETVAAAGRPHKKAADMEDAVRLASVYAEYGDAVLLSPGCASFDMYSGYAERGDAFKTAVRGLPDSDAGSEADDG